MLVNDPESAPAPPAAAAPQRDADRAARHGRILVVVAILVFAFSLRTAVTSIAPLLTRIADEVGFGATTIGVFGMMPTAMFATAGFLTPALSRRLGLERLTLAAVLVTGVGIAVRAYSSSTAGLLLWSGAALLGMGIGNIVIPPLVKRYFGDRIALMSTAYITFVQLGTAVPAALAVPVADAHGWRVSLAVWALVPAVALPPWIAIALARRRDRAEHGTPSTPRVTGLWRTGRAWGMTFMFGMTSLVTYALFTWLPTIITDAGGSESLGGTVVAVFSALGFFGTLVAPTICARLANPFGFVLFFMTCLIAGLAGIVWAPMHGTWAWVLLLGIGPTTFPMALTLINLRTRSDAESAALSGFAQGAGYLLACTGPLLVGVLHEATHGWTAPAAFLLAAIVALTAGAAVACRPLPVVIRDV
ncbi:CynX/NimT family MFS transporter [Gordonia sp. (in: high G+C Gram-positive bacteria)]|uniref:CynX/NimT family MFS transporter n=1 Tax=Gordonia sp. (in: high G+C Gram-positive bacteria) TaxID=84139 RepID=UPI0039E25E12